jgi:hypothetical protein
LAISIPLQHLLCTHNDSIKKYVVAQIACILKRTLECKRIYILAVDTPAASICVSFMKKPNVWVAAVNLAALEEAHRFSGLH